MAVDETESNSLVERRRKLKVKLDRLLARLQKYDPEKLKDFEDWEVSFVPDPRLPFFIVLSLSPSLPAA
jgi:hypothetical protein